MSPMLFFNIVRKMLHYGIDCSAFLEVGVVMQNIREPKSKQMKCMFQKTKTRDGMSSRKLLHSSFTTISDQTHKIHFWAKDSFDETSACSLSLQTQRTVSERSNEAHFCLTIGNKHWIEFTKELTLNSADIISIL